MCASAIWRSARRCSRRGERGAHGQRRRVIFKRLTDEYNGTADAGGGLPGQAQAQTAEAVVASMSQLRWMAAGATLASIVLAAVLAGAWRIA